MLVTRPPSGMSHTLTEQSSEALAIILSLCGQNAISRTAARCPATRGQSLATRPTYIKNKKKKKKKSQQ